MAQRNLSVAVLGDSGLAQRMGKKGSEGDFTMYNSKKDDNVVVYLEPSKYPEKVQGLAFCCSMADQALLCANALTPSLGEAILSLDAFGVGRGRIMLGGDLAFDTLMPLLKGTTVENYSECSAEPANLRDELFSESAAGDPDAPCRVDVSHHFKVKGVGTVVLGTVTSGTVTKHSELEVYPTEKRAIVRSIQLQDHDVAQAGPGSRPGLALKGIESDDLDRGFVLAPPGSLKKTSSLEGELVKNRFYRGPIGAGSVLHLVSRLQFIPTRVVSLEGGRISLDLEKPLITGPSDAPRVLYNLDSALPRVVGRVT